MELTVTGLSCDGCERNVEEAVSQLDGVTDVEADHEADRVVIEGLVTTPGAHTAIEDAGYEPA